MVANRALTALTVGCSLLSFADALLRGRTGPQDLQQQVPKHEAAGGPKRGPYRRPRGGPTRGPREVAEATHLRVFLT